MRQKLFFILISILQLVFLAYLILDNQITLYKGQEFKFLTAPVDPYNIFKGHYLTLSFTEESPDNKVFKNFICTPKIKKVYAQIIKDKNGFAKIESLTLSEPKDHTNYFILDNCSLPLHFPFNAFYIEEKIAQKADKLYRENNINNKKKMSAYALVKVYKGKAIVKNLYLDNKPLK